MRIFFRVDASCIMGSGHVMRCLTLAEYLTQVGHEVRFICRDYPGGLMQVIRKKGLKVECLAFPDKALYAQQQPSDDYSHWLWVTQLQDATDCIALLREQVVDWLIVDHYGLDGVWEQQCRAYVKKIMVIDDLANRQHECDLLLDQNYYLNGESRYNSRVPSQCIKLLGSQYTLMRPELFQVRALRKARGEGARVANVLVYMGGADPQHFTDQLIKRLVTLESAQRLTIHVVVGESNQQKEALEAFCAASDQLHYHCQPSYYGTLLTEADIALAAGGASVWERCFIGLPSIIMATSDNQKLICQSAHTLAVALYAVSLDEAIVMFMASCESKIDLCALSQRGMELFDGRGTERVEAELNENCFSDQ